MNKLLIFAALLSLVALAAAFTDAETLELYGYKPGNYLPVPSTAFDPTLVWRPDQVAHKDLGDGTHLFTDGVYQFVIQEHGNSISLVDCPPVFIGGPNNDNRLLNIVNEFNKPLKYIIYSHSHTDHIGICGSIKTAHPNANVVASDTASNRLELLNDPNRPVPSFGSRFKSSKTVGNGKIKLSVPQHDYHSQGDIFVYFPGSKSLLFIDIVYPGWTPFATWAYTNDLFAFTLAFQGILEFNDQWETLISGHLGKLGTRADVVQGAAYLQDLLVKMRDAMFSLTPPFDEFPNVWAVYKLYLDRSAHLCASNIVQAWGGVLAGVDVFAYEQCLAARYFMDTETNNFFYTVPLPESNRISPDGAKMMKYAASKIMTHPNRSADHQKKISEALAKIIKEHGHLLPAAAKTAMKK
jgi:glyoxylase-like metal-dependent hydrolase (beta-lactamase superfamily II)